MRRFLYRAGLYGNVPGEVAALGKGVEGPDAGGYHAEAAAHEEIPVAHAAHLHLGGLHVGDEHAVNHDLRGLDVLGGVYREFGEVLVEQAAAVLGRDLVELVVGDGLIDAVDVVAQGADGLGRGLKVVLSPVVGGIGHAGLVKEVLVVNEHDVGEVAGQAVLFPAHVEGGERGLVEAAEVHAGDLGQRALGGVGGEVFYVELVAVGGGAAGHAGLHLGKVVVKADGLDLDGDVGILLVEGLVHLGEGLLVAAGGVEVAVCNGDGLGLCRGFLRGGSLGAGILGGGLRGLGRGSAAGGQEHQKGQQNGHER